MASLGYNAQISDLFGLICHLIFVATTLPSASIDPYAFIVTPLVINVH